MSLPCRRFCLGADRINAHGFLLLIGGGEWVCQPLYGRVLFTSYEVTL